jgi:hypothetical protein
MATMATARHAALATALAYAAGCGLDLAGERFVVGGAAGGVDGAAALPFEDGDAYDSGSYDAGASYDSAGALVLVAAMPPSYDAGLAEQRPALADAGDASVAPVDPRDGGVAETVDAGDGGAQGSCARLLACCPRLAIAPPLALACYASAQQADGGDAGACDSTLASFADSGLCP